MPSADLTCRLEDIERLLQQLAMLPRRHDPHRSVFPAFQLANERRQLDGLGPGAEHDCRFHRDPFSRATTAMAGV